MSPWPWVLAIGTALLVPLGVVLLVRTIGRRALAVASGDPAFSGAIVVAPALYGGGDGLDLPAIHGTGALGLTRGPAGDELVFVLALPRREIRVPAPALTGAGIERALRLPGIYRRSRRPWLMVRWSHPSGVPCVAGFVVAQPEKWVEVIEAAARTHHPPTPGG